MLKGGYRLDRQSKEQVVAELHDKLQKVKLAVLAGYTGMNVEKITALRNELRSSGTEFRVIKNTLLRIASEETDFYGLRDHLKGALAVAMAYGDAAGPTKVLVEFAKKNPELNIQVGMLNGRLLTRADLDALANLPSKEVLVAKLLSVLVGPQAALVNVLAAVPRSFVQVLDAYRAKKEKE